MVEIKFVLKEIGGAKRKDKYITIGAVYNNSLAMSDKGAVVHELGQHVRNAPDISAMVHDDSV